MCDGLRVVPSSSWSSCRLSGSVLVRATYLSIVDGFLRRGDRELSGPVRVEPETSDGVLLLVRILLEGKSCIGDVAICLGSDDFSVDARARGTPGGIFEVDGSGDTAVARLGGGPVFGNCWVLDEVRFAPGGASKGRL